MANMEQRLALKWSVTSNNYRIHSLNQSYIHSWLFKYPVSDPTKRTGTGNIMFVRSQVWISTQRHQCLKLLVLFLSPSCKWGDNILKQVIIGSYNKIANSPSFHSKLLSQCNSETSLATEELSTLRFEFTPFHPWPLFTLQATISSKYKVQIRKRNSVAWVRERTIPTEWPPLVGEASAKFCG
jgi:hypothetical protein